MVRRQMTKDSLLTSRSILVRVYVFVRNRLFYEF